MKLLVRAFLTAVLATAGCGDSASSPGSKPNTTNAPSADISSGNPLTAPVDYLGALGKARDNAVKTIDTSAINAAIRQFQVEMGRPPKNLDELVQEKYLTRIPAPPYGTKIVYDAASGEVKVVKLQ